MSEAASPTGLSKTSMVVPIANVSSLSQAWIDALGLARHQPVASKAKAANVAAVPQEHTHPFAVSRRAVASASEHAPHILHRMSRIGTLRNAQTRDRIADLERLRVSKKIASVHPPQPDVFKRSAGRITIISRRGVVRLLMQREAGRLRITAVCDPRLVSTIADALRATNVAYAARGIQLQTSTHSEIGS